MHNAKSSFVLPGRVVEMAIGNAYAEQCVVCMPNVLRGRSSSLTRQPRRLPSDPHAFFVGGFQPGRGRGGGGGIRGRGRGLQGNRGFGDCGMGGSGRPRGQLGVGQRWNNRPAPSVFPSRQTNPFAEAVADARYAAQAAAIPPSPRGEREGRTTTAPMLPTPRGSHHPGLL